MKDVMSRPRTCCLAALVLIVASCNSPAEKARIREAASAFERALQASPKDVDLKMIELQNAIDNVSDDNARYQLQHCERLLATYMDAQTVSIDIQGEQRKAGRGGTYTSNDLSRAIAKATSKEGVPELRTITACSQTLRKLTD